MVAYKTVTPLPGYEDTFKMLLHPDAEAQLADWKVLGKPLVHHDAVRVVTGEMMYTDDHMFMKPLYAKILHSPYANANIKSIDTSKAEALPGVKAVVTYKDIATLKVTSVAPSYILIDKVTYVGDIVAGVCADDPGIAEQALDLIAVTYEELPFVLTGEEAAKPDAPVIHPSVKKNNLAMHYERKEGDPDAAFAGSDAVVQAAFRKPNFKHMFTQTHAAIAQWKGDELYCWGKSQSGSASAAPGVASIFGMKRSKVHFVQDRPGGSYGGSDVNRILTVCAMLGKKAGTDRAVKLMVNGVEEFTVGHGLEPNIVTWNHKAGAKKDGTLTALTTNVITSQGRGTGGTGMLLAITQQWNNVRIPHRNSVLDGYHTNILEGGALRAYGSQAGEQPFGGILSELAEKLNMDPRDLYIKNGSLTGDVMNIYIFNDYYNSGVDVPGMCQRVGDLYGWKDKWKGWKQPTLVSGSKRRGVGMAVGSHMCGWGCGANVGASGRPRTAIVMVTTDGTINANNGAMDVGNGMETGFCQVIGEVLGVTDISLIEFTGGEQGSSGTPESSGGGCSWSTASNHYAAWVAATEAKTNILNAAAVFMNVKPEEVGLDVVKKIVYLKADPTKTTSLARLLYLMPKTSHAFVGVGAQPPYLEGPEVTKAKTTGNDGRAVREVPLGQHGYFAGFVEVEVDTETGKVDVLKIVDASQPGMTMNPRLIFEQTVGGLVHGWSQMMGEGVIYDEGTGTQLNPSLTTYLMWTVADVGADSFLAIADVNPADAPLTQFKGKGFSEGVFMPLWAAIAEGIYNACGIRMRRFPFTPWEILNALGTAPFPEKKGVA